MFPPVRFELWFLHNEQFFVQRQVFRFYQLLLKAPWFSGYRIFSRKTDRPSSQVEFEALAALVGLQLNKRDVVVCCACPENTLTYIFRCATYSEMTWKFSCTKMSFTFTAFNWSFLEFAIIRLNWLMSKILRIFRETKFLNEIKDELIRYFSDRNKRMRLPTLVAQFLIENFKSKNLTKMRVITRKARVPIFSHA